MSGMRGAMLSRRRLLASAWGAGALTVLGGVARPYLSRATDRPSITHGIQSGDISRDGGIVWARADRPARMTVEAATTESFRDIIRVVSADALPDSDFTAKVLLDRLPAGQDIFYRVRFHDIASPMIAGEPQVGRFRMAPGEKRDVSFVWSGDTAGGWGIDESRGGMRTYATMLAQPAGLLRPLRRQHLRRVSAGRRTGASERRGLAQPCDGREVARRRNARRLSRQLQIQSARPQPARLQRRGPDVRPMGRSRGDQRLVAGPAVARRRCRHHRAGGARLPGVPRVHADATVRGRARAHLSQDRLRAAARRVHARHAQLSRAERRRQAGRYGPAAHFLGPRRSRGSSANWPHRARPGR